MDAPVTINSLAMASRQLLLGERFLLEGNTEKSGSSPAGL
jgi:hypothetical protein